MTKQYFYLCFHFHAGPGSSSAKVEFNKSCSCDIGSEAHTRLLHRADRYPEGNVKGGGGGESALFMRIFLFSVQLQSVWTESEA